MPPKTNVERFLASKRMPEGANKWRVLTGIAHSMTEVEMSECEQKLLKEREERLARMLELNAPQVIIDNERQQLEKTKNGTSRFMRLFQRVRESRIIKATIRNVC